jgi:hypothetical protein
MTEPTSLTTSNAPTPLAEEATQLISEEDINIKTWENAITLETFGNWINVSAYKIECLDLAIKKYRSRLQVFIQSYFVYSFWNRKRCTIWPLFFFLKTFPKFRLNYFQFHCGTFNRCS